MAEKSHRIGASPAMLPRFPFGSRVNKAGFPFAPRTARLEHVCSGVSRPESGKDARLGSHRRMSCIEPLSRLCLEAGCVTRATVADHTEPHRRQFHLGDRHDRTK
jgi:hypothetical protein